MWPVSNYHYSVGMTFAPDSRTRLLQDHCPVDRLPRQSRSVFRPTDSLGNDIYTNHQPDRFCSLDSWLLPGVGDYRYCRKIYSHSNWKTFLTQSDRLRATNTTPLHIIFLMIFLIIMTRHI